MSQLNCVPTRPRPSEAPPSTGGSGGGCEIWQGIQGHSLPPEGFIIQATTVLPLRSCGFEFRSYHTPFQALKPALRSSTYQVAMGTAQHTQRLSPKVTSQTCVTVNEGLLSTPKGESQFRRNLLRHDTHPSTCISLKQFQVLRYYASAHVPAA